MTDSRAYPWEPRAGVILAVRYVRTRPLHVRTTPLEHLPRLSRRMIRAALFLFPHYLDRADLSFPIIVAGRGWYQITLDGRHRLSKALMIDQEFLPTVRVPWAFALELLIPGVFEVEWAALRLARRFGRRRPVHPHPRPTT